MHYSIFKCDEGFSQTFKGVVGSKCLHFLHLLAYPQQKSQLRTTVAIALATAFVDCRVAA